MFNWSTPSPRTVLCRATTLVALVLAGCQTIDPVRVERSFITEAAFASHSPACVAVLPIQDGTPDASAQRHLTFLYQELTRRLVAEPLNYSPTAMNPWVDATLRRVGQVDGSILLPENLRKYATGLQRPDSEMEDDCVLAVRVEEWNEKTLMVDRRVTFRLRAAMMAKDGILLWSGEINGSAKAGGGGAAPLGRDAAARSCAQLAIEQLLLSVPPRLID